VCFLHCSLHLPEEDVNDVSAAEHLEAGNCVLSSLLFDFFLFLFFIFEVVLYFQFVAYFTIKLLFMTCHCSISLDLFAHFTPALCQINKTLLLLFLL
jgi:hypothetical protein